MELLNFGVPVLGFVVDPLVFQLIDLDLADGHDVHIFIGVRQVSKGGTNGNSCGQC